VVVHACLRRTLKEKNMEYLIAGIVSFALFVYLIYALLRPEKF
jgi:K+-transporting ATPase KdpF subunit